MPHCVGDAALRSSSARTPPARARRSAASSAAMVPDRSALSSRSQARTVHSQTAVSPRTASTPRSPSVRHAGGLQHPAHAAMGGAAQQQRGGRLGRQRHQQHDQSGAMCLHGIDPAHEQIEQPVAHRPLRRRLGQRLLVGMPPPAQQDRPRATGSAARAGERKARRPRRIHNGDSRPAFVGGQTESRGDQRLVEFFVMHGQHIGATVPVVSRFARSAGQARATVRSRRRSRCAAPPARQPRGHQHRQRAPRSCRPGW